MSVLFILHHGTLLSAKGYGGLGDGIHKIHSDISIQTRPWSGAAPFDMRKPSLP